MDYDDCKRMDDIWFEFALLTNMEIVQSIKMRSIPKPAGITLEAQIATQDDTKPRKM